MCFRLPPPEETVMQNGDSTAKGVLATEQNKMPFAVQSPLAAKARNTFPRQLETLRDFLTIVVYRVIVGLLVS
jgi:hypothetical protein